MNDKTTFFVLGMGAGIIGTWAVAKALRPTIKEKLAVIAARQITVAAQSAGIAGIIPPEATLKTTLLYPAIDEALRAAWI